MQSCSRCTQQRARRKARHYYWWLRISAFPVWYVSPLANKCYNHPPQVFQHRSIWFKQHSFNYLTEHLIRNDLIAPTASTAASATLHLVFEMSFSSDPTVCLAAGLVLSEVLIWKEAFHQVSQIILCRAMAQT